MNIKTTFTFLTLSMLSSVHAGSAVFCMERDGSHYTPLGYAVAFKSREEISKELTKVSVDAPCEKHKWESICTPLYLAIVKMRSTKTIQVLLNEKPNLHAGVEWPNGQIDTPLGVASARGHFDSVELLLKENASPFMGIVKADGRTCSPLLMASWSGHEKVVEQLLKANANPDLREVEQGDITSTPLTLATTYGYIGVVQALLAGNASPTREVNDQEGNRISPLMLAKENGHDEIAKILRHAEK